MTQAQSNTTVIPSATSADSTSSTSNAVSSVASFGASSTRSSSTRSASTATTSPTMAAATAAASELEVLFSSAEKRISSGEEKKSYADLKYQYFVPYPGGAVEIWAGMGKSLIAALKGGQNMTIVKDNEINFLAGITGNTGLIAAISVCFLLAFVALVVAPYLIYGIFKSFKKEEDATETLLSSKIAKPKPKLLAGEEKKEKLYSQSQRHFAVLLLFFSFLTSLACMIILSASNTMLGQSWAAVHESTKKATSQITDNAQVLTSQLGKYQAPSYVQNLFSFATSNYEDEYFQAYFPRTTSIQNALIGNLSTIEQSLETIQAKSLEITTIFAQLNAELDSFERWLSNATYLDSPPPGCLMSATLPNLVTPYAVNYDPVPNLVATAGNTLNASYATPLASIIGFTNVFRAASGAETQSRIQSMLDTFSGSASAILPVVASNLKAALTDFQYMIDQAMISFLSSDSQRSVGIFVILAFALPICIASTTTIAFKCMRAARILNILNILLVSLFWIACAFTLGFAVFSSHMCDEVRVNGLRSWKEDLKLLGPSQEFMDAMFTTFLDARKECYYGDGRLLSGTLKRYAEIQMASNTKTDKLMQQITQPEVFAKIATADQTSLALSYFDGASISPSYRRDLNPYLSSVQGIISQFNYLLAITDEITRNNFVVLIANAQAPLFFRPLTETLAGAQTKIDVFAAALTTANFNGPSTCVTRYRTDIVPGLKTAFSQQFTTRIDQIEAIRSNMASMFTQMKLAQDNIRNSYTGFTENLAIVSVSANLNAITEVTKEREKARSSLESFMRYIAEAKDVDIQTAIDCSIVGAELYKAEDYLCGKIQIGYDATYWALGALGVVYFIHFYAIRLCIDRLVDDSRWLIMAMLIKNNFGDKMGDKTQSRLRKNVTGTTYLQEDDFNLNF